MLIMFSLLIAVLVAVFGFSVSRRFVRDRLRFVDAVQRASAPWLAGGAALLIGTIVVALIPGVGFPTALTFALAVGSGVAAGARDVRQGNHLIGDGR